jgi:NTE family protein
MTAFFPLFTIVSMDIFNFKFKVKRKPQQPRIGVALGGGGAKGICHIAFLQALDELGVKPAIISGSSIGAIVGGLYAAGNSGEQLLRLLRELSITDLSRMVLDFSLWSNSAILKGKGVEEFLGRHLPQTFSQLRVPLKVVATDFWSRREVVLETGDLMAALRASMALPVVFEPVVAGKRVLIDGGAVNPLPYDLIKPDCDITIAIDVSGVKTADGDDPVPNMLENILSTFQIMQASIVEAKKSVSTPDIYVRPALTNIRVLDFHRYKEILEGVRHDVVQFKKEVQRHIRNFYK